MLSKFKEWIFKGVIVKKVVGKFVKHTTGFLAAYLASKPFIDDLGITIDWSQFEAYLVPTLVGLFGAGFNYVQHRFVKEK